MTENLKIGRKNRGERNVVIKKNKKNMENQRDIIKKVLLYIKKYWLFLVLSLCFAVITVFATLYIPVLTGEVIDKILHIC